MYEVEVKVSADLARVRERLEALDAEALGAVEQVDTYYDHPTRSFAETDEALRVRREADSRAPEQGSGPSERDRAALTYKGPKVDDASKTRREVELGVGDPDAADALLRALGFEPAGEVRKARERYVVGGYLVTLDVVEGLGEFVEVETEADEADVASRREGAHDVLGRLGLDPDDQVRVAYLELLADARA